VQSRAVVQTADRQIRQQLFQVPELPPDHALLKVEACGMCGSDYEQYTGRMAESGLVEYPLITGHEIVGRIAAFGSGAAESWQVAEGDRVAVEAIVSCKQCRECQAGRTSFCRNRFIYGYTTISAPGALWGGYADYMLMKPGTKLHALPEHMTSEDAVLFNPLGAGFDWAVRAAGTRVGDTVLIFGPGQRGLACVLAAREAGAAAVIVAGRSTSRWRLELARELGATHVIESDVEDVPAAVRELTNGDLADRTVDASAHATQAIPQAIEATRPEGTIVLAGIKATDTIPGFNPDRIFAKSLTLRGVFGVSSWAKEQAIRVAASGRFPTDKLHTHTLSLEEVEHGVRMLGGEVPDAHAVHITVKPV
jgi:threonine dehydrogenase-like Zn-dependent dehydrogenase